MSQTQRNKLLRVVSWTMHACMLKHSVVSSMGFSWQEYWSKLPFPLPGDHPDPGIETTSLMFPALLSGKFFTTSTTWEALAEPSSELKLSGKCMWIREYTSVEESTFQLCFGRNYTISNYGCNSKNGIYQPTVYSPNYQSLIIYPHYTIFAPKIWICICAYNMKMCIYTCYNIFYIERL